MRYLLILLISVFNLGLALAQENSLGGKTKIENAFSLRDPFKSSLKRGAKKDAQEKKSEIRDGTFTNYFRPKLSSVRLTGLKVVGVMIGENRRAICEIDGFKGNVILKEGEKVGPDNAELKAILPGGLIFVEKIINVYGQDEFLETVIPISK
jgi:hypothetical protein